VIQSDRTVNPHAWELKKVYQPIYFKAADLDSFSFVLENHHNFTDASEYDYDWILAKNGEPVKQGKLSGIQAPAGKKQIFNLDLDNQLIKDDAEYHLTIRAKAKSGQIAFIEAGEVVAWEQFALNQPIFSAHEQVTNNGQTVEVEENASTLNISGNDFAVQFDTETGVLIDYKLAGQSVLKKGLTPNVWRVPTDNDAGARLQNKLKVWKDASENQTLLTFNAKQLANGNVEVITKHELGDNNATFVTRYIINDSGAIDVNADFYPQKGGASMLPKVGMNMVLNGDYKNMQWFGRGPHENYVDRNTSAAVAIYQAHVDEQYHDYSRPQETGNKTDVRWLKLTNKQGQGILIKGHQLLSTTALPMLNSDIEHDRRNVHLHGAEVPIRELVNLHIDYKQMGIGGDNSWGALPQPEYRIPTGHYHYGFTIKPVLK